MAFCTTCGANVQGAFCTQCGAVAPTPPPSQAAAPIPPAPAQGQPQQFPQQPQQFAQQPQQFPQQPLPQQPMMAPVPPAKRGLGCLGWGLIIAGIMVVLGVIAIASIGGLAAYFVRNPGVALAKIITASNPDAEVISTDEGSKSMRIRDRKTGEEVTLSFDDVKNGRFKMHAIDKEGKAADIEIGGGTGKLPAWVPTYPGAKAQGNVTARGMDANGMGEGGTVTFTTSDPPARVTEFYEAKCKEMGMTVQVTQTTAEGGLMVATDEGSQRSLNIMVGGNSGETSITVIYGRKR